MFIAFITLHRTENIIEYQSCKRNIVEWRSEQIGKFEIQTFQCIRLSNINTMKKRESEQNSFVDNRFI